MKSAKDSIPPTDPAPTTQAPVEGCPLCDTWKQWVAARMQERGSFATVPISPAELHDLLMIGAALPAVGVDVMCSHHKTNVQLIAMAMLSSPLASAKVSS